MTSIRTRMGDGRPIYMTADEVRRDIVAGSEDAADRGRIPTLSQEDYERLFDLFANPAKIVGVEQGHEVITTQDGGNLRLDADAGSCGLGIGIGRLEGVQIAERAFTQDTMELGHIDYSFKQVKPIFAQEQAHLESILLSTIVPIFYGAMPNLGLYYAPDGPHGNPSDLLPQGKIKEALEAQELAVEQATRDMVYVSLKLAEVGCDGINYDTTAAAGDADFLATLKAVEQVKASAPDVAVEVGMASEFILGMHGGLEYDGARLAGMYPHEQVKVAERAGVDIFGPVVNTNTSRSIAWNVSRAVTFVKACVEASNIPVHPNVGMGVGGVAVHDTPPIDSVSRASVAMVEIALADGL